MIKSRWDRGDVDRVADESLDASLERVGCWLDAVSVGDEGPSGLPDFAFFPSPNNDRFFAFSSVLSVFPGSVVSRAISEESVGWRYGRDCPRMMVAPSARLMAITSGARPSD